jgi:glucose/arabinose dehydrogenase
MQQHFIRNTQRFLSGLALSVGIVSVGALGSARAQAHVPLADPIPTAIPVSDIKVSLQEVLSGLVSPVTGAFAPGDKKHLYVVDQIGLIWLVNVSPDEGKRAPDSKVFLDVSSRLVPLGLFPPLNYDERGLLGLAFHPDFKKNGLFYTYTSQPVHGAADFSTQPLGVAPDHQSVLTEWRVREPRDDDSEVDLNSARELMRIDEPQFNHNGGALAFGPDELLYISLGDGGAADDQGPGHALEGNGQNLAEKNILGKILRIDPLGRNSANGKYGIPTDNPFLNKPGADEIFAYGFRNPFRMSFDDKTGKLYVGDVGQNDIEEVDVVRKGRNYGWPIKEGAFLFDNNGPNGANDVGKGFVFADSPGSPAGLSDPLAEYDHVDGPGEEETRVAVIGGFVYRGTKLKALKGRYVFGDYSGEIGTPVAGHLFVLDEHAQVTEVKTDNGDSLGLAILGFANDGKGELYVLANATGTLNGTTGVVLKLTRAAH